MSSASVPRWLDWAREIQALSQTGLTYSDNDFDRQRYQRLGEIAADIVSSHTVLDKQSLLENLRLQPGYATPKVDVRGAVIRDGQVLLVQERVDERWCMPGGWADVGDLPSEMVIREVWEESGFHVLPREIVGVYDANRDGIPLDFHHAYKIVFMCEITGGQARPSDETLDVGFFDFGELPPLSSSRTHERHLAEVLAHVQDPGRAVAFD